MDRGKGSIRQYSGNSQAIPIKTLSLEQLEQDELVRIQKWDVGIAGPLWRISGDSSAHEESHGTRNLTPFYI